MKPSRLIAIGDIHGCARALAGLLEAIQPRAADTIVILGDVVDRGSDSRAVVQKLIELHQRCRLVPIQGNHEEMLLAATASTVGFRFWMRNGGRETLQSYARQAVDCESSAGPTEQRAEVGNEFEPPDVKELMGSHHIDFLHGFLPYYETDQYLFVHANYEPDLPLNQQPGRALRWDFVFDRLPAPHCSGKTAVVGHSTQESGQVLDLGYFVCLDTNITGSGWLTAMDLGSGQIWQADRAGKLRDRGR